MRWHIPLNFDDVDFIVSRRWAGELLAIAEFSGQNEHIKIEPWYGLRASRPFPEHGSHDNL